MQEGEERERTMRTEVVDLESFLRNQKAECSTQKGGRKEGTVKAAGSEGGTTEQGGPSGGQEKRYC